MTERSTNPTRGCRRALAIVAHPDDIEFLMGGTLLLLKQGGWETHYCNLSSGNCGSLELSSRQTAIVRGREARAGAAALGAIHHPSFTHDLEIFYNDDSLRRVAALIRDVKPSILLTHSPQDYMEDHMSASRLTVSGAFVRGAPNYRSTPPRKTYDADVTIYHAMPHGLRDSLRKRVTPGAFVNTTSVHAVKRAALAKHESQKAWLDATQGMESYLRAMDEMSMEVGRMHSRMRFAEGWRRHSHLGFCAADADPLREALGANYVVNQAYERGLNLR